MPGKGDRVWNEVRRFRHLLAAESSAAHGSAPPGVRMDLTRSKMQKEGSRFYDFEKIEKIKATKLMMK